MAFGIADILGGNIVDGVTKLIGQFVASPEQKAALAEATMKMQEHSADLEAERQAALLNLEKDRIDQQSANIRTDSSSTDWMVRRARPLFLWVITLAIGFNLFLPLLSQLFGGHLQPLPIPAALYGLFATAYTGYAAARTIEKVKNAD